MAFTKLSVISVRTSFPPSGPLPSYALPGRLSPPSRLLPGRKHIPLNSYISLNKPIYDEDSDRTLLDVISGTRITDPEELVISREEFDNIEAKMSEILESLEWKVLMFYLEGKAIKK